MKNISDKKLSKKLIAYILKKTIQKISKKKKYELL